MKKMKQILLLLLFLGYVISINAQEYNQFFMASWNVENLFDSIDDTLKNDEDFTPRGNKEWTEKRVADKIKNLSAVLRMMNKSTGPDVIGFMEVEHQCLLDILFDKYFPDRRYKSVGFESPDIRGIDNYLVFDEDVFNFVSARVIPVEFFSSDYVTRDILHVVLNFKTEELHFFVNHWPSRRGGEVRSEPRRINAASALRRQIDSLANEKNELNVIIMGDFNDEPNNYSISNILSTGRVEDDNLLLNLTWNDFDQGIGTHLYKENFNMLDQIIISRTLGDNKGLEYKKDSFEIFRDESFIYTEGKMKGAIKPTFHSGKYVGGYSDHLPVTAIFYLKEE